MGQLFVLASLWLVKIWKHGATEVDLMGLFANVAIEHHRCSRLRRGLVQDSRAVPTPKLLKPLVLGLSIVIEVVQLERVRLGGELHGRVYVILVTLLRGFCPLMN